MPEQRRVGYHNELLFPNGTSAPPNSVNPETSVMAVGNLEATQPTLIRFPSDLSLNKLQTGSVRNTPNDLQLPSFCLYMVVLSHGPMNDAVVFFHSNIGRKTSERLGR